MSDEGILGIIKQHKLVVALAGATALIVIAVSIAVLGGGDADETDLTSDIATEETTDDDAAPASTDDADDDGDGTGNAPAPASRSTGNVNVEEANEEIELSVPKVAAGDIPDWGMRTQGINDELVKFGISYNKEACGDAAFLEAMLGTAVTGDAEKAVTAFERHINDTGGIGGRELDVITFDDGGAGCPEKNVAAAEKMTNEDKVFFAAPGLHVVSDYMAERNVPIYGGREDPESMAKIAPNGIGLLAALDPTFQAWSSFGRHYLETADHTPCLIRPESGASGDWDTYSPLLQKRMKEQGLEFEDEIVYKEDVATAQQQANTMVARAKGKGCDQAWFMAGNALALIFLTSAATQNQWFPTWTWTSYTIQTDDDDIGKLMDQQQWENAIGLSTRVPPGEHKDEGNCKEIYESYYDDGTGDAAFVDLACATILPAAEIMRRAEVRTGVLTGDSLFLGADAIRNDFFFDAHVPIEWRIPDHDGPFKTKGFSHWTVAAWSTDDQRYLFPDYPKYWRTFGANKGNSEDLRGYFQ